MEVYCYEDADGWVVTVDGRDRRCASRTDAFAAAKELLRVHSPSQLVRAAPGAAPPSDRRDDGYDGYDDDPGSFFEDDGDPGPMPPVAAASRAVRPRVARPTAPAAAPAVARVAPPRRPVREPDWPRLAGPAAFGRSVLVATGADAPPPWAGCARVAVDDSVDPDELLAAARAAFLARTPVVYECPAAGDPAVATSGVVRAGGLDVWRMPVGFEFAGEAAWHLITANAVDARDPTRAAWPWAEQAIAAGAGEPVAGAGNDAAGDVVLPDGRPAYCDGGPLRFWTADDLGHDPGAAAPLVLSRIAVEAGSLAVADPSGPTADLAPDQLESVGEPGGRSRIIAPAGSGKTRVLTERARYLLGTKHVPAAAVTLVAFNKRAQLEMTSRTTDLPDLQVQTLNALALAILNGGRRFRSRGASVRTIDELAVRRILSDMVKFPRRANTDPAASWIDALSAVRLGLRDPSMVEAEFNGDVDGFAEFFPAYRRALRRNGEVDFDEQIYLALEVLLTEPDTRHQAQRVCRLMMVDEFQDLTPAHLLLIRLLAGPESNVFGVGDDDQTIYGYSGASPDWLIDFDRYFPGATHHALQVNYRCPAPVVTAASNLLSHNRRRVPKEILTGPANATDPTALRPVVVDEPVTATVDRVVELVAAGAEPRQIVVLSRVNTLLAPIQVALHLQGIACTNPEGVRFLERTGVAAALSWLQLATAPTRFGSAHLQRAARRPGRSLSPKVIEWMAEQHDLAGITRFADRLKNEKDALKVHAFVADVERIRRLAADAPTARILEFVRADIGLDRAMQTLDAAHRGRNATAHSDDLRALIALGRLHPDAATFGAWLPDVLGHGRDEGGVQLATVHKVKGLEWPHVVVHDATQGLFPHHLSTDIEEERRVFHVAITRGQQSVTVVADAEAPSMFLDELATPAPPVAEGEDTPEPVAGGRERSGFPAVAAAEGLELTWGGYAGSITAVEDDSVLLTAGRAQFRITYGSVVTVDGRPRQLAAPTAGARRRSGGGSAAVNGLDGSENPTVLDALKAWRRSRAQDDAVPAYVVAADKTLIEIAAVLPTTPKALLAVNGIGPAKLERYGDEILAVIDEAPRS